MPTTHEKEASRAVRLTGSLFVALAAFGFSAKAILVKLAYFHQVDAVTLLALRMAFALPFFLLMGLWGRPVPGQDKLGRADAAADFGRTGGYAARRKPCVWQHCRLCGLPDGEPPGHSKNGA